MAIVAEDSPVALTISLTYTAPGGSKIVRHRSLTKRDLDEQPSPPFRVARETGGLWFEIVKRIDELAAEADPPMSREPDLGSARWVAGQPGYLPPDPAPVDLHIGPIIEFCPGCGEERTDAPDDQWAREVESCRRVFHEPPDPSFHEQQHQGTRIFDEAVDRIVDAVKNEAPDWLCDRCGMTADGFEELPLGWTRAWQQTALRFVDLCSGCTAAYIRFLDQPARERRESKARLEGLLRQFSAQIEADRANAGLMTRPEAMALFTEAPPRSWLDRLRERLSDTTRYMPR